MIRYKIGFEKTKAAGVLIEERGEHMPTTYTHYRFGKDVLDALPRRIRTAMETNRELFDIGLHGPDILFYYRALIPNSVSGQGYGMHKQMADLFFERAKKVIADADDKTMSRAYIYGFICHFALDSECHPYVEKMIQKSGIGHSEIEMEFDRYLLTEDKFDPLTYRQTEHIHATEKNAKVVAPFFDHVTAQQARKALTGLLLSVLCPFTVQAQIASPQAFQNLSWKMVKEESIETEHGVVQSICATDDYIVCLENVLDGSGQPDIVKAYYRNDKDKNGNPVEQYSLAMQVQETDYEHANGMAYNPNTNEIAVSLYTSYQKENRGCLFIMDADTLKFKRKVKVTDSYNILGIGYDSANDRYVIQTNADGGYQFKILNNEFQVTEDLGDLGGYAGDGNYQDLCVTEDYVLNFPLTLFSGNGDFLNVYSLSEKKLLYYEKLDFQFEDNVTSDEPESICELDPGVFLAVVNVTLSDGTKKVRLYRMEVPYQYEVEVKVQVGEDKPSVSRKTVLRGEAFEADYPEKEGYRIASVKIDKKEIDLEKYQSKYTLKSVQGAHTISIVYEKKLAMWKIILPVCVGVVLLSAGFVFYLRVLQIRRIRRRKLEAEKRRRARIKWHNDEWNIDEIY